VFLVSCGIYLSLYCMGERWYNPATGRFLTKDSYPPDLLAPLTQNPYQYCENNPVNRVDPEGTDPKLPVIQYEEHRRLGSSANFKKSLRWRGVGFAVLGLIVGFLFARYIEPAIPLILGSSGSKVVHVAATTLLGGALGSQVGKLFGSKNDAQWDALDQAAYTAGKRIGLQIDQMVYSLYQDIDKESNEILHQYETVDLQHWDPNKKKYVSVGTLIWDPAAQNWFDPGQS